MDTDAHFCDNPRCPYHSVIIPEDATGISFASLPKLDIGAMLTNEPIDFEHKWVKRIRWIAGGVGGKGKYKVFCENCAKAVAMACDKWIERFEDMMRDMNIHEDYIVRKVGYTTQYVLEQQEMAIERVTERVTRQLTSENWQRITFLQDALQQMTSRSTANGWDNRK